MAENDEKPTRLVGIKYEPGEGLPRIIVKGSGKAAEEMLNKRSVLSGPKVFKNKELVDKLFRLPIDAEISEDTFQLVAVLLAHVFSIEEKLRSHHE